MNSFCWSQTTIASTAIQRSLKTSYGEHNLKMSFCRFPDVSSVPFEAKYQGFSVFPGLIVRATGPPWRCRARLLAGQDRAAACSGASAADWRAQKEGLILGLRFLVWKLVWYKVKELDSIWFLISKTAFPCGDTTMSVSKQISFWKEWRATPLFGCLNVHGHWDAVHRSLS